MLSHYSVAPNKRGNKNNTIVHDSDFISHAASTINIMNAGTNVPLAISSTLVQHHPRSVSPPSFDKLFATCRKPFSPTQMKVFYKRCLKWWNSYRYRFLPWIIYSWKERSVHHVCPGMADKRLSDARMKSTLMELFTAFESREHSTTASNINCSKKNHLAEDSFCKSITHPDRICSEQLTSVPKEKTLHTNLNCQPSYNIVPNNSSSVEYLLHHKNLKILKNHFRLTIERRQSKIKGGGTGVFVTSGTIPPDTIAALYPGVVYSPGEPLLLQSFGNAFIFRCIDGLHIDGNDRGISKFIYRSCSHRDKIGMQFTSDMSWLTPHPVNPLAIGQYVNNHTPDSPANVSYQEFDFPETFPVQLRQFIPNINFSTSSSGTLDRTMRTVALVSLCTIETGEELLSSYYTVIRK